LSQKDSLFTFYVQGADRLTGASGSLAQALFGMPFSNADKLWQSFQKNVANFVKFNNSYAAVSTTIKLRPDYDGIKEYLDGTITINQRRDRHGCQ